MQYPLGLVTKAGVTPGSSLVSVSLPSVPGVSLSLPTMVSTPSVSSVTSIQPGQSLLTSNRVQPGNNILACDWSESNNTGLSLVRVI